MAKKRRGKGEGSIRWREDRQSWEGSISLGHNLDGTRSRTYVYGKTKKDVLRQIAELQSGSTASANAGKMTVGELLALWQTNTQSSIEYLTNEQRKHLIKNHLTPRLGDFVLVKLTSLHIEKLWQKMRADTIGEATVSACATLLFTALEYAVGHGLILANPARKVKRPKKAKTTRHFVEASSCVNTQALFLLALATGCRLGELLALSWSEVDLVKGTLTVKYSVYHEKGVGHHLKAPKSQAGYRTISLPESALQTLQERYKGQEILGQTDCPVFCTRKGTYYHSANVSRALKRVIRAVNEAGAVKIPEDLHFHDLRHTHASLLLSAGCSLRAVAQRLGHGDPAITLRVYAHCLPADDAALAANIGKILS